MNNPNPFVPKGSLLEQQSARRSRLKLAVFCVLAVSITGLVAVLINGCKRTQPDDVVTPPPPNDTNLIDMGTNQIAPPTNTVIIPPPTPPQTNVVVPPIDVPPAGGSEYVVVKGDSLAKIAKKSGVTLKALQAANPGVVPTKLKIGQKLVIPAGGKTSAGTGGVTAPTVAGGGDTGGASYKVVSGDTLTKIAKKNGTTVKALQAANNLTTTKIHVGQKLTIPSKAGATVPPPATAPVVDTTPAPPVPPVSTPPAVPTTSAPAH